MSASDPGWLDDLRAAEAPFPLGSIGAYEVVAEVARGGQGVVYRARQPGTGREVALKRLLAGSLATPEMRRRFEREVSANAMLNHPNIVTLYGIDVAEGQPVLAMQWIEGRPITHWARTAPRPSRAQVVATMRKVCDAVHHAHQRGVLHRDLKPSNLLVDARGEPHVLDFGLAKLLDTAQPDDATLSGHFLGTPAYASPEQLRGEARAVDVRSDIWSLGAVLYELLTGQLPYRVEGGLAGMLKAVDGSRITAPSTLEPTVPRDLDLVVLKALSQDPAQRYASVDALSEDLRRFQLGEPVLAHPPSTLYLVRKALRRHRLLFGIATVAFVLVSALAVVALVMATRLADALADAEGQRTVAEARGAALAKELLIQRGTLRYLEENLPMGLEPSRADGLVEAAAVYGPAEEHLAAQIARQPDTEASIRTLLSHLHLRMGHDARALDHLEQALARTIERDGPRSARVAECHLQLAIAYKLQTRWAEAEATARRVLELLDSKDPEEALNRASALSILGVTLTMTQRSREALAPLEQAVALLRVHDTADHPYLCDTLQNLALAQAGCGHADAERTAREALATLTPNTPPPDWRQETARRALSRVLWAKGPREREEAVRITDAQLEELSGSGRVPPHMLAEIQLEHAGRLLQLGRNQQVLTLTGGILELTRPARRLFKPSDLHLAMIHNLHGRAQLALGERSEARVSLGRARDALLRAGLTPDSPELSAVLRHLAEAGDDQAGEPPASRGAK